jgi:hypothetical protein
MDIWDKSSEKKCVSSAGILGIQKEKIPSPNNAPKNVL